MGRLERHANIQRHIAEFLNRQLTVDGYLVTVSYAELTPNEERLKIFVSVLPDKYFGTALKTLRALSSQLRGELARSGGMRRAPKIEWLADTTEKQAAELEEVFREIEE